MPAAPRKDQYVSPSEADSLLWRPPGKIFRYGRLKYHKAYKGPQPISYVDTGVYAGCKRDYFVAGVYAGCKRDYFVAYNKEELRWIRQIDYLLENHGVARYPHAQGKYVKPEYYYLEDY
jgi:hypothetical protein